jgi:acylphosphatase
MKVCRRCLIKGKVQGVYFRQATFEEASALGITGWVRNLASGDVEALICGEVDRVELMCDWLWAGPPAAKVQEVVVETLPWQEYTTFMIRK